MVALILLNAEYELPQGREGDRKKAASAGEGQKHLLQRSCSGGRRSPLSLSQWDHCLGSAAATLVMTSLLSGRNVTPMKTWNPPGYS